MTKTFEELEDRVNALGVQLGTVIDQLAREDVTRGSLVGRINEIERRSVEDLRNIRDLERLHLGIGSDSDLAARVRALEILIEGDKITREEWARQKALGVTPNIAEPPIGALQAIENALESVTRRIADLHVVLGKRIDETSQRFVFLSKLESFFGPMIRDKNPPLDGQQIADRAYVDESVARIARALRSEYADASNFTAMLLKTFGRAAGEIGDTASVQIMRATSRIVHAWERSEERDRKEDEKAHRPSRLRVILWAITGRSPEFGAVR